MLQNVEKIFNTSEQLVFHGSFKAKKEQSNVLLLLPKTKGPFGTIKFEKFIKNDFNVVEYDDVKTESLGFFDTSCVTSLEDKASAINIALDKWKGVKFHIICHSTGCGLGTFLAKKNKQDCKSLILISPWNRADNDFTLLQKKRVKNAKELETILFLRSEYDLLYSSEYIYKFNTQFNQHIHNQKNNNVDAAQMEMRLQSILDCNIGNELRKLMLPKLLINAVDDKLMKAHHGQELKKISTNTKLISLDNGGHMLTETRANDLIVYIKSFIDSLGK